MRFWELVRALWPPTTPARTISLSLRSRPPREQRETFFGGVEDFFKSPRVLELNGVQGFNPKAMTPTRGPAISSPTVDAFSPKPHSRNRDVVSNSCSPEIANQNLLQGSHNLEIPKC